MVSYYIEILNKDSNFGICFDYVFYIIPFLAQWF